MKNIHTFYTCKMQAIIKEIIEEVGKHGLVMDPQDIDVLNGASKEAVDSYRKLLLRLIQEGIREPILFSAIEEGGITVQWSKSNEPTVSISPEGDFEPWWTTESLSFNEIIRVIKSRVY